MQGRGRSLGSTFHDFATTGLPRRKLKPFGVGVLDGKRYAVKGFPIRS